jgi:hypothetical protein
LASVSAAGDQALGGVGGVAGMTAHAVADVVDAAFEIAMPAHGNTSLVGAVTLPAGP